MTSSNDSYFQTKKMKASFYILIFILIVTTATAFCIFSNTTTIHFNNRSDVFIDSAVVYVQGYKITFADVKPQTQTLRKVSKDSVQSNNHDVTILTYIYDRNKSVFKGTNMYYDDLSGSLENSYTITIQKDLTVHIRIKND